MAAALRSDANHKSWREISGNLPTDFGFTIDVHAHEPDTVYVVPITSDYLHVPLDGRASRLPQPHRRRRVEPLTSGLPQEHCYVNVLRDAMAVDSLDECGVYAEVVTRALRSLGISAMNAKGAEIGFPAPPALPVPVGRLADGMVTETIDIIRPSTV